VDVSQRLLAESRLAGAIIILREHVDYRSPHFRDIAAELTRDLDIQLVAALRQGGYIIVMCSASSGGTAIMARSLNELNISIGVILSSPAHQTIGALHQAGLGDPEATLGRG